MRHRLAASRRPGPAGALYLVPERKLPRASYVPAGRTLHLIDIENLVGGTVAQCQPVHHALASYFELAAVRCGDHVVIGAGSALLTQADLVPGGARLVLGRGVDGADLALLAELRDIAWVAARFDRVVVGSGDGIFAEATAAIRAEGIAVGVVAVSDRISWKLRRVADFVVGFDYGSRVQGAA